MSKLSEREIACLHLLDGRMDATPEQIGAAVMPDGGRTKRGRVTVGHRVADGLWQRVPALATFVSSRIGYAITPAGRSALAQQAKGEGDA